MRAQLCTIGLLHGEKLLAHYRFSLRPEQFTLQRAQSVRKALRSAVTNLKKTYQSLMDLSFPELGGLLQLDGVGIRQLLIQAPTPGAIAGKRLCTLEKNWMVRPKAAALKALAADSNGRCRSDRGQCSSLGGFAPSCCCHGSASARARSADRKARLHGRGSSK